MIVLIQIGQKPEKGILLRSTINGTRVLKCLFRFFTVTDALLGGTHQEAALSFIDQWIHLAETEVDMFTNIVRGLCIGRFAYSTKCKPSYLTPFQIHHGLVERQTRSLKTLENHISTRTSFVEERITSADLYIAATTQNAVSVSVDAELQAQLPNLVRHLETIVRQRHGWLPDNKDGFEKFTILGEAGTDNLNLLVVLVLVLLLAYFL
jgi:hypothetical protein